MQTRRLIGFLLTVGIVFARASDKKSGAVFSEPQSMLLFYGENGDLNLVTPSEDSVVPHLPHWIEQGGSLPVISPSGNRIARGLTFTLNADAVKCDPSNKRRCDPQPRQVFKTVMGVYSMQDKEWKQYGDFESVGSVAFQPDGNKVAFWGGCNVARCDGGLMILDLGTGLMTRIPGPGSKSTYWNAQLSWSPDGKYLAGTVLGHQYGYGQIVVIDLATGEMKTIAEGHDPSWSPKGDWIAYGVTVQCMIVHPDGTGARSVLEKEPKWMSDTLGVPIVWSPDGEKLLLNQWQVEGYHSRVIMVDLATGHVTMKSKNGEMVMGWVPYSGK